MMMNLLTLTKPEKKIQLLNDMAICQSDYPLDWYQSEFMPYAESYLALPDRRFETVIEWMTPYIKHAHQHFSGKILLLAHYYMGGTIVKLIEHFGGLIGDSYQLALMASHHPEKSIIIESAVHFMAETISILANENQQVFITNPKAGCTMEMNAKDYMIEPCIIDLNERYGEKNIVPICYMNTSGRVKALTGIQGGAVCTSSNVKKIFEWALGMNKKILFIPDQHMGENVASWVGIQTDEIAYWPAGALGATYSLFDQDKATLLRFDRAKLILFSSHCGVHTYFSPDMAAYWRKLGYCIVAHPECRKVVIDVADAVGSTAFIWDYVINDQAGTKHYAIATENHMVENLKQSAKQKGITVVNVGNATLNNRTLMGCGCATMSRNDPPHLVALLDLLAKGKLLDFNEVQPGDVVNEFTGQRQRLEDDEQQKLVKYAKVALQNMITITENSSRTDKKLSF
jgi:quinolinate synthase